MDGYAPAYLAHNLPLLIISGLGSSSRDDIKSVDGTLIASDIPSVESDDAQVLLKHFRNNDARDLAWNSRENGARNRLRVKTIGRKYMLPPRKAQLPQSAATSPTSRPVVHSTLSPLSPGSPLYPDGLLNSVWVEKHQEVVPCTYLSFYIFTSDPKLSTLHDNQLKTDINNIKRAFNQSGYKTRHIVALLSEESIVQGTDVEERLGNIRKTTGLDSKTSLFFLPPKSSPVELQAFVENLLSTIYPVCVEYYRDLSKHSRRKRNRGFIPLPTLPPTSGTSKTLSSQGWNVRFDFKLGVFAEFRQEMDSAVRSYESGYEGLLGQDVLEAIASWSPRWNEARLLADVFSIRILRCFLWNGNSTMAVRRWQMHRDRIRDFIDRRGKGSTSYGWEAWEARWATVMAELIKKTSFADFGSPLTYYLQTEKAIPSGERMQPWDYLHHPGYWFRAASKHLMARRDMAIAIPEEDRILPGSSPASQIANRASIYDTYLCPEPHEEYPLQGYQGVNHCDLIIGSLSRAIIEFEQRGQHRLVQELQLMAANESMKQEAWDDALKVLRILWPKMTFRREGWWNAVEEVGWALRKAATKAGDGGSIVAVDWEMMNRNFTHHNNWHYDLTKSLQGIDTIKVKPAVVLHEKDIYSFLSASYTFEYAEGKVGEPCFSQLAVTSNAFPSAAPVTMSEIVIQFEGSMKAISLGNLDDDTTSPLPGAISWTKVLLEETLQEGRPSLTGKSSLMFRPGQTRVFEFSNLLREAGEARAISATFSLSTDLFDLEYVHGFEQTSTPDVWWGEKSIKKRIVRVSASSITVLPKPPKLDLQFVAPQEQYYTNEPIKLQLEVINGEENDSLVNLDVRLLGDSAPPVTLNVPSKIDGGIRPSENGNDLEGTPIGKIATAASVVVEVYIYSIESPATYEISVKAAYNLVSDIATTVYYSTSLHLEVINPFEANYDFASRVHPDPWPSLFTHHDEEDCGTVKQEAVAQGLAQKWCLTARYASFALDELLVEDVDVKVLGVNGGIKCDTKKLTTIPEGGLQVTPRSLEEAQFDVSTQKVSLDDRGTATLDVSLMIRWRRIGEDTALNTTILAVPRLLVSSSEPRVLAAVSYSAQIPSMIHFDVTIENPSAHFLTFGVVMEPSEKFAFSGVKQSTLQLVPLSRRTLKFRLLPSVRGEWIGPIHCVIRDRYFQKVLKIAPTEGMKLDKEGVLVWVPPEDDFEA